MSSNQRCSENTLTSHAYSCSSEKISNIFGNRELYTIHWCYEPPLLRENILLRDRLSGHPAATNIARQLRCLRESFEQRDAPGSRRILRCCLAPDSTISLSVDPGQLAR